MENVPYALFGHPIGKIVGLDSTTHEMIDGLSLNNVNFLSHIFAHARRAHLLPKRKPTYNSASTCLLPRTSNINPGNSTS